MKTAAEHKKSAGAILQSNVSLRSRDSWVNYLSLILLLLIFIEITAFLSCTMFSETEELPDVMPTSRIVGRKTATTVPKTQGGVARFGSYAAFSEMRGGKEFLILRKGEEETIVDEGTEYNEQQKAAGFGESFSDIKFSAAGGYLLYSTSDNERPDGGVVYDIKNAREITREDGVEVGAGFDVTPDEKYFFYCRDMGLDAGVPGKVHSLPDFKEVFSADSGHSSDVDDSNNYLSNDCVYNRDENSIVFMASEPNSENMPQGLEKKFPLGK